MSKDIVYIISDLFERVLSSRLDLLPVLAGVEREWPLGSRIQFGAFCLALRIKDYFLDLSLMFFGEDFLVKSLLLVLDDVADAVDR